MTGRRGISLLDLIAPAPGSQAVLPDVVASKLEEWAVVEHRASTSGTVYLHDGVIQPLSEVGLPALSSWPVEVPGLNTGIRFRLARLRQAAGGTDNWEPAANDFSLDLFLDRVAITFPGLRAARRIDPGTGSATAAHLVADPDRRDVKITGAGVLRIDLVGESLAVRFIDWPDPFDPTSSTGTVVAAGFDPPHFLIGETGYGLTVNRLVYDASEQYTPPDIVARGQGPAWEGISIAEATLFFPRNAPLVDDLSIGVRDVLLGRPFGLQGEIRIELGRTPVNPDLIQFLQNVAGSENALTPSGTGLSLEVPFIAGTGPSAQVRALIPPPVVAGMTNPSATWRLPNETTETGTDTGYFTAREGQHLKVVPSEEVDDDRLDSPEIIYTFKEQAAAPQHAPQIGLTRDGTSHANVVHVAGIRGDLDGIIFTATPGTDDLKWQLGTGSGAATGSGAGFTPGVPPDAGTYDLVLTDDDGRKRRLRYEILDRGTLVIGTEAGPVDDAGTAISIRALAATHDLTEFHSDGKFTASSDPAALALLSVTVPNGSLAEVTLELGTTESPDETPSPAPPVAPIRHVQILMEFNDDEPIRWGPLRPTAEPFSPERLQEWADGFTGDVEFVIIGRCCDIGTESRNRDLAVQRAGAAAVWLAGRTVHERGEQHSFPSTTAQNSQAAITPPLSSAESSARWLVKDEHPEHTGWGTARETSPRPIYRRVDIYAEGGTVAPEAPTEPNDGAALDPALRRTYVPGDDATSITLPGTKEPALAFLVRLVVKWDSPTVAELADAIPTQAELTIEWQSDNVTHPQLDTTIRPSSPGGLSTEVFTIVGRWSYDARSGQTVFSLSLESSGDPSGLASVDSDLLAMTLGLGPALIAGVQSMDPDTAAVRLGALVGAAAVAVAFGKDGRVVLHKLAVEQRQQALMELSGSRTRLLFDYTSEIGFDISADGIGAITTDDGKPLKVRYKNVGLEFDDAEDDWMEKLGLVYEDVSFEIEDPGRWQIDGPLGQLLRVTGSRAGSGSTWFEVDLEFALDLGVITITGATVRVTLDGGTPIAELRGLGAKVEIPGTLEGSGRVSIGDGGTFRAGLEVTIIPLEVTGVGSLAMDPAHDFFAISAGLVLPVGIPLGASGLGLFGFLGRFVSNGTRDMTGTTPGDPVQREIDWYRKSDEQKYGPERGQWALGLGTIAGTMPDTGFTFNALGMFVIEFPDPLVVFGIDAKLLSKPEVRPSEEAPPPSSLQILGIVAIDPTAVAVGVRGEYTLPKVLNLKVPISGYFPLSGNPGAWYIRVGADGHEGRTGDPITLTFLPTILDVRAWAYFMIEERELHRLGGDDRFNFDGFSLGFGTGWEIRWSAGPIKLEASAKVLVGLGTKPFLLKGGVFVRGELSLVVISISVSGELIITLWEEAGSMKANLQGEFCGKVSFFFFSIKGCVGIEIGDSLTPTAPPPDPPIGKVVLTDRRAFITAEATKGTAGPEHTVWPDTVPVIDFTHLVENGLAPSSAFQPGTAPAGEKWSGTSEMKYAYRVTGVDLVPAGGSPLTGPLDSAWWLPTHRPGVLGPGDVPPSQHEGRQLALLTWDPAPWSQALGDGSDQTPGDPSTSIDRLCDPPARPVASCVLGHQAERVDTDRVRIPPETLGVPPFPARFELLGDEVLGGRPLSEVVPHLTSAGLSLDPGRIVPPGGGGEPRYELPVVTSVGRPVLTAGFVGDYLPDVVEPDLTLFVCRDQRQEPGEVPTPTEWLCADYSLLKVDLELPNQFQLGAFRFENLGRFPVRVTDTVDPTGQMELMFPDGGLRIELPDPMEQVRAGVATGAGSPVELLAFDSSGANVAAATSSLTQGNREELTVTGPDIVEVIIHGGGGEGFLTDFCAGSPTRKGPLGRAFEGADTKLPRVHGGPSDGGPSSWIANIESDIVLGAIQCMVVRYRPPHRGPWDDVTVEPWMGGTVGIISSCGISHTADEVVSDNEDFQNDLRDEINDRAAGDLPARRHLLEADTSYELRIQWQYQSWVKSETEQTPPPVSGGTWIDGTEQRYRFETAAHVGGLGSSPPPVDFLEESTFDPRSLQRYLIGFDPNGADAPPHFLDDPVEVHFSVDHAEQLCNAYDRELVFKLRRTDPPPGTLIGGASPADVPLLVAWGPLRDDFRPAAQLRILDAIRTSPCLDEPAIGGSTATLTADLEPNAEYDLLLVAPPTADPTADEVLIDRAHFRTSRYRNLEEMLDALRFTPTAMPILAGDALVTMAAPGGTLETGDAPLETTLIDLGLDPWPLPHRPRATLLWWQDGGWKLAGLLLETDEPLLRDAPRALEVRDATVGPLLLTPVRANTAGTRVLLAPAVPGTLPAEGEIELVTRRSVTGADGSTTVTTLARRRRTIDQPRMAYQEAGT